MGLEKSEVSIDLNKGKQKKKRKFRKTSSVKKPLKIKFLKDNEDCYSVVVNGKKIGEVKRGYNFKWTLEPFFLPLSEQEEDITLLYDGPIEASRDMVKLWEKYKETTKSRLGPPEWYEKVFKDLSF